MRSRGLGEEFHVPDSTHGAPNDPVRPATRQETLTLGLGAVVLGFVALSVCTLRGYTLLYGDAVAHLGIARAILDTNTPGLGQLGGVWLPLPHLLMLPFIGKMEWWQDGMAGAWPSLVCYILAVMGMFRLARRLMPPRWALVAAALFAMNANLLYLATTAMTEPLFLAEFVWIALVLLEFLEATGISARGAVARTKPPTPPQTRKPSEMVHPDSLLTFARERLVLLGMLVLAATMTRYDGWVLGAAVWCVVSWRMWKIPQARAALMPGFVAFTLLAVAGPLCWFGYNHVYGHDWLDFMRGPYSAKEIDRKTSPPGAHKYWGWHNPVWSLMLYARTAQVDAAAWETGWLLAAAALWGTWRALKDGARRVWLLLWLPLPFYVYSISYGSVPIFIPQLYPHSYYNSRYGMEMLPALALFGASALWALTAKLGKGQALAARLGPPVALMLVVVNAIVMIHATPLVLKEAMVNSQGRLAYEEPLARQLATFPRGATILMENSDHVGALQKAGIPLRQTIGPSDYYRWREGLAAPAETAGYVVAAAGDPVSEAVKAHPEGLTELTILCTSKWPCVRIYQSDRYAQSDRNKGAR